MTAVGDVQIPGGVHRHAYKQRVGPTETGAGGRSAISERGAKHQRSGTRHGVDRSAGIDLAHGVVAFIGEVDIAGAVDNEPLGVRQRGAGGRSAIARVTLVIDTGHGGDHLCAAQGGRHQAGEG